LIGIVHGGGIRDGSPIVIILSILIEHLPENNGRIATYPMMPFAPQPLFSSLVHPVFDFIRQKASDAVQA
jgi:hypothetical protein